MQTSREGRFLRFGKKGSSDFLVYIQNGITIHLEVKNEKGKLSEAQEDFRDRVNSLGHVYRVVRSYKEFDDLFNVYLFNYVGD